MQDGELRRAIGGRLKECRVSLGLSQPEVGEAVSRTAQAVSNWELGKSTPVHPEDWHKIGLLFGVSLDYLFFGVRTVPVSTKSMLARIFTERDAAPSAAACGTPARQPAS